jgi:hypothetical protein
MHFMESLDCLLAGNLDTVFIIHSKKSSTPPSNDLACPSAVAVAATVVEQTIEVSAAESLEKTEPLVACLGSGDVQCSPILKSRLL